jgi:shikimate dehydrogenase
VTDRYAVIGNPVAHSKSPDIHAAFARATAQDIGYERLLAPLDGFARTVVEFRTQGGKGANVTVPFKEEAFRLCDTRSARAQAAGAVNTLLFEAGQMAGDNTDGTGLIADLKSNLGQSIAGRSVLLLGAGGAARGVLHPLSAQGPRLLTVCNRTLDKAGALASAVGARACSFDALAGQTFDIVINATSAGLKGEVPPLPPKLFAPDALAYDMVYGTGAQAFLAWARGQGAARCVDGLGMLVEQAAESFLLWRGLRPDTAPVLARLRQAAQ